MAKFVDEFAEEVKSLELRIVLIVGFSMKLIGKFEGKVILALLIGILQEAKVKSEDTAVICEGLESEPLFSSVKSLM